MAWSRMAVLAVHALLLSAGPLSTCRVEAAAAAASAGGSGWSALSTVVMAARPHNGNLDLDLPHPTTSTTAPRKGNRLFRRRRDGAEGRPHSCGAKEELDRWRFQSVGRRKADNAPTTKDRNINMHRSSSNGSSNRRSWLGWVHAKRSSSTPAKGGAALSRKVLGVKEAVAATGLVGSRIAPSLDVSRQQQQEQQLRDGLAAGWMKRFQRARTRATSSSSSVQEQQQQGQGQGQQEGPIHTKVAAMRSTGTRARPQAGSAPSVVPAEAAVLAETSSVVADAAASPSPVPSYLQWPSKSKSAAATAAATASRVGERENGEEAGGGGADGRMRNKKKTLGVGVGSRTGRPRSRASGEAKGEGEGSLGAATSSRGGGGPGAVSLTFKEAMFAGAISRSIAQVRYNATAIAVDASCDIL